jgi:hypothetical protein
LANVTFDGPNYLIIVNNGITELDAQVDLYSDWKEWIQQSDNMKYFPAFRTVGGDTAGVGKRVGDFYFLQNQAGVGWRIRPYEGDHTLVINGNLYPETSSVDIFTPTLGNYTVLSVIERSLDVLTVEVGGGGGGSADEVWDEPLDEHTDSGSTGEALGKLKGGKLIPSP